MMHCYFPPSMSTTEVAAITVAVITSIGGIASAIYAFRNNASGIKNDVINTYEKRVKQLEDAVEELTTKVDEMKTLLEKSENARLSAEQILQGRNPELDKFMTITLQMLTDIHGAVMPQTVSK